jgi:hypothetical protein
MSTQAIAINSPTTGSRIQSLTETLLFTAAGVGTLFLLGKLITLVSAASGLPNHCWQSTAARAGASAFVVGSLTAMRRGHLALFGAAYAVVLLASHASPMLLLSAVLAGGTAYGANRLLSGSHLAIRVLIVALSFNLMLTLSGFIKAFSSTNGRTGLAEYANGTGLRIASTVIVGLAIVLVARIVSGRRRCAA